MHEVQHWIQDHEGFASGASVRGMSDMAAEFDKPPSAESTSEKEMTRRLLAKLTNADKDKLRKAMTGLETFYKDDAEMLFDGVRSLDSFPPMEFEGITDGEQAEMKRIRQQARNAYVAKSRVQSKVQANPLDAYWHAAGEIEARDVAGRRSWKPPLRDMVEPYSTDNIAPEDAIVMFGRGPKEWAASLASA